MTRDPEETFTLTQFRSALREAINYGYSVGRRDGKQAEFGDKPTGFDMDKIIPQILTSVRTEAETKARTERLQAQLEDDGA